MRVLVLGSGGREHALVRALRHSVSVTEVHVAPGSAGMQVDALCHNVDPSDQTTFLTWLKKLQPELVVVGPEIYLAQGLSDEMRSNGFNVFGPSLEASRLESSKIFSKKFMQEAEIPTAPFEIVSTVEETLKAAERFSPPYVLKADGLAAGKGVTLHDNLEDLKARAEDLFEKQVLKEAGRQALLEGHLQGWELSFLCLTDGHRMEALPLAQDHKRLLDGDEGPNTGGMGVVAPVEVNADLRARCVERIITPTLKQIGHRGMLYRGVVYFGIMVTKEESLETPQLLEYNVRFGDPEAQALLPLLDGDWGLTLLAIAKGQMQSLQWRNLSSACVVMAAPGYPDQPQKGVRIEGDISAQSNSSYFLHAGTSQDSKGHWVTNGGRVLNAIGLGSDLKEALRQAYAQTKQVKWKGMRLRHDIGKKLL